MSFFADAILSIFQINTGNPSHFGILFTSLSLLKKISISILTGIMLLIIIVYIVKTKRTFKNLNEHQKNNFYTFGVLFLLFVFCLTPAIITIRLEQRWLLAPFCIFITMLVIALSSFKFKDNRIKNSIFLTFIACFLISDCNYFYNGVKNLYITNSQSASSVFETAIKKGIIRYNTSTLYLWEQHRDYGFEGDINWDIGGGNLFWFYQNKSKKIFFIDSTYLTQNTDAINTLPDFTQDSVQILYYKNGVFDITDQFLKDSLKCFKY